MSSFGKLAESLHDFTSQTFGEVIPRYDNMMTYKIIIFGVVITVIFGLVFRYLSLKLSPASKNTFGALYTIKFIHVVGNIFLHLVFPLNCCYFITGQLLFSLPLYLFFFTLILFFRAFFYFVTTLIMRSAPGHTIFLQQYQSTINAFIFANLAYFLLWIVQNLFFMQFPALNNIWVALAIYLLFLIFDIIRLIKGWMYEKLSFFLIILYLCTLKILPIVYLIDILWFFYEH